MTKLTAKKGMVKYKVGHGKEDFDYAFLEDIPMNKDLISLKTVLETITNQVRDEFKLEVDKLREEHLNEVKVLNERLDKQNETIIALKTMRLE